MIGIIDYGMGNLLSVQNAFEMAGADVLICETPEQLEDAERIVLPGVGAFRDCIAELIQRGFKTKLDEQVLHLKKPIFGICLGMQVMAKMGYEFGEYEGLGWFDAEVVNIRTLNSEVRVPHVGWNQVDVLLEHPMFSGIKNLSDFYFVHSYYMKCNSPDLVVATTNEGCEITAAVAKENIFATQFHPEKSQDFGLQLIENFLSWKPVLK